MVDVPTTDFAGYHGRNRPFPFCGRIIEAYYTNPELDTVCVTYREDEQLTPDGEPRAYDYYMEVDETDARFQALLKEYSYETIQETTEERARVYRKDFQNIVKEYIKENGLTSSLSDDRLVEKAQKKLFDSIINFDEQDVKHKEELFRLKLLVFESDVAENANRDQKVKIRKASSPLEVLATYYDIIKPKPKRKTRSKKKSEK
tara:strand:+ start:155 stop:763 length:609 start_codon:yes stop_codon:yes gene_type:complete